MNLESWKLPETMHELSNFFSYFTSLFPQIIEKRGPRVPIVIVCNKTDLSPENHQLKLEVVESVCRMDWGHGFVETSAKDHANIVHVFKELLVQANIRYNLSPAVRRRRMSLPSFSSPSSSAKFSLKRHSCSVS